MDKFPDNYEYDGQLSLFPVEFSKCMNHRSLKKRNLQMKKYRVSRMIDGYLHSSCIKCKDKDTDINWIKG